MAKRVRRSTHQPSSPVHKRQITPITTHSTASTGQREQSGAQRDVKTGQTRVGLSLQQSPTKGHQRLSDQGVVYVSSYMKGVWKRFGDLLGNVEPNVTYTEPTSGTRIRQSTPITDDPIKPVHEQDPLTLVEKWINVSKDGKLNKKLVEQAARLHQEKDAYGMEVELRYLTSIIDQQANRIEAGGNQELAIWVRSKNREFNELTSRLFNDPEIATALNRTKEETNKLMNDLLDILMVHDSVHLMNSRIITETGINPSLMTDYVALATAAGHLDVIIQLEKLLNDFDKGSTLELRSDLDNLIGELDRIGLPTIKKQAANLSITRGRDLSSGVRNIIQNHINILNPDRTDPEVEKEFGPGGWEKYSVDLGNKVDIHATNDILVSSMISSLNSIRDNIRDLSASTTMSQAALTNSLSYHLSNLIAEQRTADDSYERTEGDSAFMSDSDHRSLVQDQLADTVTGMLLDSSISSLTEQIPMLLYAYKMVTTKVGGKTGLMQAEEKLMEMKSTLSQEEYAKHLKSLSWLKQAADKYIDIFGNSDMMNPFAGGSGHVFIGAIGAPLHAGNKFIEQILPDIIKDYAHRIDSSLNTLINDLTALRSSGNTHEGEVSRLMETFNNSLPHTFKEKIDDRQNLQTIMELMPWASTMYAVDLKYLREVTSNLNNLILREALKQDGGLHPSPTREFAQNKDKKSMYSDQDDNLTKGSVKGYRSLFMNRDGYAHSKGSELGFTEGGVYRDYALSTLRDILSNLSELERGYDDSASKMKKQIENIIRNHYTVASFRRSQPMNQEHMDSLREFQNESKKVRDLYKGFIQDYQKHIDSLLDSGATIDYNRGRAFLHNVISRLRSLDSIDDVDSLYNGKTIRDAAAIYKDNSKWFRETTDLMFESEPSEVATQFANLTWNLIRLHDSSREYDHRNDGIRELVKKRVNAETASAKQVNTDLIRQIIKDAGAEGVVLANSLNPDDSIGKILQSHPELHLLDRDGLVTKSVKERYGLDDNDIDIILTDILKTPEIWSQNNYAIHNNIRSSENILLTSRELPNDSNMLLMGRRDQRVKINSRDIDQSIRVLTPHLASNINIDGTSFDHAVLTNPSILKMFSVLELARINGHNYDIKGSAVESLSELAEALIGGNESKIIGARNKIRKILFHLQKQDNFNTLADQVKISDITLASLKNLRDSLSQTDDEIKASNDKKDELIKALDSLKTAVAQLEAKPIDGLTDDEKDKRSEFVEELNNTINETLLLIYRNHMALKDFLSDPTVVDTILSLRLAVANDFSKPVVEERVKLSAEEKAAKKIKEDEKATAEKNKNKAIVAARDKRNKGEKLSTDEEKLLADDELDKVKEQTKLRKRNVRGTLLARIDKIVKVLYSSTTVTDRLKSLVKISNTDLKRPYAILSESEKVDRKQTLKNVLGELGEFIDFSTKNTTLMSGFLKSEQSRVGDSNGIDLLNAIREKLYTTSVDDNTLEKVRIKTVEKLSDLLNLFNRERNLSDLIKIRKELETRRDSAQTIYDTNKETLDKLNKERKSTLIEIREMGPVYDKDHPTAASAAEYNQTKARLEDQYIRIKNEIDSITAEINRSPIVNELAKRELDNEIKKVSAEIAKLEKEQISLDDKVGLDNLASNLENLALKLMDTESFNVLFKQLEGDISSTHEEISKLLSNLKSLVPNRSRQEQVNFLVKNLELTRELIKPPTREQILDLTGDRIADPTKDLTPEQMEDLNKYLLKGHQTYREALTVGKIAQQSLVKRGENDDVLVHAVERSRWEGRGYSVDQGYLNATNKNLFLKDINFRGTTLIPSSQGISTPWSTEKNLTKIHDISRTLDRFADHLSEVLRAHDGIDTEDAQSVLAETYSNLNSYMSLLNGPDSRNKTIFVRRIDGTYDLIDPASVLTTDNVYSVSTGLQSNNGFVNSVLKRTERNLRESLMSLSIEMNKVANSVNRKIIETEVDEYKAFASSGAQDRNQHRTALGSLLQQARQAFNYKRQVLSKNQVGRTHDTTVDRRAVLAKSIKRLHKSILKGSLRRRKEGVNLQDATVIHDMLYTDSIAANLLHGRVSDQMNSLLLIGGDDFLTSINYILSDKQKLSLHKRVELWKQVLTIATGSTDANGRTLFNPSNIKRALDELPKIQQQIENTTFDLTVGSETLKYLVDLSDSYFQDSKTFKALDKELSLRTNIEKELDRVLTSFNKNDLHISVGSEDISILKVIRERVDAVRNLRGDELSKALQAAREKYIEKEEDPAASFKPLPDSKLEQPAEGPDGEVKLTADYALKLEIDKKEKDAAAEAARQRALALEKAEQKSFDILKDLGLTPKEILRITEPSEELTSAEKGIYTKLIKKLDIIIANANIGDTFLDRVIKDESLGFEFSNILGDQALRGNSPLERLRIAERNRLTRETGPVGQTKQERTDEIYNSLNPKKSIAENVQTLLDIGTGEVRGLIPDADRHPLLAALERFAAERVESLGITDHDNITPKEEKILHNMVQDLNNAANMLRRLAVVRGHLETDLTRVIDGRLVTSNRYLSLDIETLSPLGDEQAALIKKYGGEIPYRLAGHDKLVTLTYHDSRDGKMHYVTKDGNMSDDNGNVILTNQEIFDAYGIRLESVDDFQRTLDELSAENGALLTHNGVQFDIPVLKGNGIKVHDNINVIDTMRMITDRRGNYNISLDNVSQATLNRGKTGKSSSVASLWKDITGGLVTHNKALEKAGDLLLYNAGDSALTRGVYLEAQKTGSVLVYNDKVREPVFDDEGNPVLDDKGKQVMEDRLIGLTERKVNIEYKLPEDPMGTISDQFVRSSSDFTNQIRRLNQVDVLNTSNDGLDIGDKSTTYYELVGADGKGRDEIKASWKTLLKHYYELKGWGTEVPQHMLNTDMIDAVFMDKVLYEANEYFDLAAEIDPRLETLSLLQNDLTESQRSLVKEILEKPELTVEKLAEKLNSEPLEGLISALHDAMNSPAEHRGDATITAQWIKDNLSVLESRFDAIQRGNIGRAFDEAPELSNEFYGLLSGTIDTVSPELQSLLNEYKLHELVTTISDNSNKLKNLDDVSIEILNNFAFGTISREEAATQLSYTQSNSLAVSMFIAQNLIGNISKDPGNLIPSFVSGAKPSQLAGVLIHDGLFNAAASDNDYGVTLATNQIKIGSDMLDTLNTLHENPKKIRGSLQEVVKKIHNNKFSDNVASDIELSQVSSMEPDTPQYTPTLGRLRALLAGLGADAGHISGREVILSNQLEGIFKLRSDENRMDETGMALGLLRLEELNKNIKSDVTTEHDAAKEIDIILSGLQREATLIRVNSDDAVKSLAPAVSTKLSDAENVVSIVESGNNYSILKSENLVEGGNQFFIVHNIGVGDPRHVTTGYTESVWDTFQRFSTVGQLDRGVTANNIPKHSVNISKIMSKKDVGTALKIGDFLPDEAELKIIISKLRQQLRPFMSTYSVQDPVTGVWTKKVAEGPTQSLIEKFIVDLSRMEPTKTISHEQAETIVILRDMFGHEKVDINKMPSLIEESKNILSTLSEVMSLKVADLPAGNLTMDGWNAADAYRMAFSIAKDPKVQQAVKAGYQIINQINELTTSAKSKYGQAVQDTPLILAAEAIHAALGSILESMDARRIAQRVIKEEFSGKRAIQMLDELRITMRENPFGRFTSHPVQASFDPREAARKAFDDPMSEIDTVAFARKIEKVERGMARLLETHDGIESSNIRNDVATIVNNVTTKMPKILSRLEEGINHLYKYSTDKNADRNDLALGHAFLSSAGRIASEVSGGKYVRLNAKQNVESIYGMNEDGEEFDKSELVGNSAVRDALQDQLGTPSGSIPKASSIVDNLDAFTSKVKERDIFNLTDNIQALAKSDRYKLVTEYSYAAIEQGERIVAARRILANMESNAPGQTVEDRALKFELIKFLDDLGVPKKVDKPLKGRALVAYNKQYVEESPWNKFVDSVMLSAIAHKLNLPSKNTREEIVRFLASTEVDAGSRYSREENFFSQLKVGQDMYMRDRIRADKDLGSLEAGRLSRWIEKNLLRLTGKKTVNPSFYPRPANLLPDPDAKHQEYIKGLRDKAANWDGKSIDDNYWSRRKLESLTGINGIKTNHDMMIREHENVLLSSKSNDRIEESLMILKELTGVDYPADFRQQYNDNKVEVDPHGEGTTQFYDPSLTVSKPVEALRLLAGDYNNTSTPAEFLTSMYILGDMLGLKDTLFSFQSIQNKHEYILEDIERTLGDPIEMQKKFNTLLKVSPLNKLSPEDASLRALQSGLVVNQTFDKGRWTIMVEDPQTGETKKVIGNPNHMVYNAPHLTPQEVIANNADFDAGIGGVFGKIPVQHVLKDSHLSPSVDAHLEDVGKQLATKIIEDWKAINRQGDDATRPYTVYLGEASDTEVNLPAPIVELKSLLSLDMPVLGSDELVQLTPIDPTGEDFTVNRANKLLEDYINFRDTFDERIAELDEQYTKLSTRVRNDITVKVKVRDAELGGLLPEDSPLFAGLPPELIVDPATGKFTTESLVDLATDIRDFSVAYRSLGRKLEKMSTPRPLLSDKDNIRIHLPIPETKNELATAYYEAFEREIKKYILADNSKLDADKDPKKDPVNQIKFEKIIKPKAKTRSSKQKRSAEEIAQDKVNKRVERAEKIALSINRKVNITTKMEAQRKKEAQKKLATQLRGSNKPIDQKMKIGLFVNEGEHLVLADRPEKVKHKTVAGNEIEITVTTQGMEGGGLIVDYPTGQYDTLYSNPTDANGFQVVRTEEVIRHLGMNEVLNKLEVGDKDGLTLDLASPDPSSDEINIRLSNKSRSLVVETTISKTDYDSANIELNKFIIPEALKNEGADMEVLSGMIGEFNNRISSESNLVRGIIGVETEPGISAYTWGKAGWSIDSDYRIPIHELVMADLYELEKKFKTLDEVPDKTNIQASVAKELDEFLNSGRFDNVEGAFAEWLALLDIDKLESAYGGNALNALTEIASKFPVYRGSFIINKDNPEESPSIEDFKTRYASKTGKTFKL